MKVYTKILKMDFSVFPGKRFFCMALALCAMVFATAALGSCKKVETRKAFYFYEVVCPSCEESKAQEALGGQAFFWAGKQKNMELKSYDLFHTPEAIETLSGLYEKYKIDQYTVTMPILFVDDVWYIGREAIEAVVNNVE